MIIKINFILREQRISIRPILLKGTLTKNCREQIIECINREQGRNRIQARTCSSREGLVVLPQMILLGSFCRYWRALYFWSLWISHYSELFYFLSFITFVLCNLFSSTHRGSLFWGAIACSRLSVSGYDRSRSSRPCPLFGLSPVTRSLEQARGATRKHAIRALVGDGGGTPRNAGWGCAVRSTSQSSYNIFDQICDFPYPI